MFSATKFVVAGVIVALFGGFLLSGVLTTQPSDESVPIGASTSPGVATLPAVELPAEVPEGIDSGTLDTPLGPARWVHLNGDVETLPDIMRPVPVPGGYVSLDQVEDHFNANEPAGQPYQYLWFSPDLLEWTRRPLPVDAGFAQLSVAGGEYWLTVNAGGYGKIDRPSLWRSSDTLEWEPVDLTGLKPPEPATIDWGVHLGEVTASGDAMVVPMSYEAQNSWSYLGLPPRSRDGEDKDGEYAGLERVDDGSYRVLGAYDDEFARVRFEATDGGLRVIDTATGADLTVLEGVGMDLIERWTASGPEALTERRLVVVQDGRVESVELPELPEPSSGTLTLFGSDGGFIAFQTRPDGLIQTWTSPDGVAWTLDEVLGDDPGEPADVQEVWPADLLHLWIEPDGLVAWSWGEVREEEMWVSSDGIAWQLHHPPPGDFNGRLRLGSHWIGRTLDGWLAFYAEESEDGTKVDVGPLHMKNDTAGAGGGEFAPISSNTIALSVWEDEQSAGWQRDHWIITFDDPPASGGS